MSKFTPQITSYDYPSMMSAGRLSPMLTPLRPNWCSFEPNSSSLNFTFHLIVRGTRPVGVYLHSAYTLQSLLQAGNYYPMVATNERLHHKFFICSYHGIIFYRALMILILL